MKTEQGFTPELPLPPHFESVSEALRKVDASRTISRAIEIVENGNVDVASGVGTFTAEERDIILRGLQAKAGEA